MENNKDNLQNPIINDNNVIINNPTDDNSTYNVHSLNNENSKKYERVFILFLWISAFSDIVISAIVSIGVMYILLKQHEIIDVGERGPIMFAAALLLCASILSIFSGILTCSITSTKGKFILTIILGYVFAIGFIISNIILLQTVQLKINDGYSNRKTSLLMQYMTTINDSSYINHWKIIYKEFNCCGLEITPQIIHENYNDLLNEHVNNETLNNLKINEDIECLTNYNNCTEFLKNISKNNLKSQKIQLLSSESELNNELKEYEYSNNLKTIIINPLNNYDDIINTNEIYKKDNNLIRMLLLHPESCMKLNNPGYRDCSWLLLNALESKLHLLQLYGNLLFPIIIISSLLCIFGYILLRKLKITVNKHEGIVQTGQQNNIIT